MINTLVSGRPAALPPGWGGSFGLFAFYAGDSLAVDKHRDVAAAVPGAFGLFVNFVHEQAGAAVQVDPRGQGFCWCRSGSGGFRRRNSISHGFAELFYG